MTRPLIIASALVALVTVGTAACTRAPSSAATPGDTTVAAQPAPSSPSTRPGAPIPDQRTPQPAPDTAAPTSPGSTPSGTPVGGSRAADSAHVAALEQAAVALAKTTGCSSDDQCRNAPVGIKGCGGPRYYLKYCALSTDTTALFAALARLDSAERLYNAKYHVVSTCQMILPTRPRIVAGACH